MKKFMLLSMLLMGTFIIFGQSGKKASKMDYKLIKLTETLELTADQQTKVKALYQENRPDTKRNRKAFVEMTPEEQEVRMAEVENNRVAVQSGMKEILTEAQLAKYMEMPSSNRGGANRGGANANHRLEKMSEELNLRPDQKAQVATWIKESRMKKPEDRSSISEAEKKVIREQHKEKKEIFKQRLLSILDEDQIATFKQLEEERKGKRGEKRLKRG